MWLAPRTGEPPPTGTIVVKLHTSGPFVFDFESRYLNYYFPCTFLGTHIWHSCHLFAYFHVHKILSSNWTTEIYLTYFALSSLLKMHLEPYRHMGLGKLPTELVEWLLCLLPPLEISRCREVSGILTKVTILTSQQICKYILNIIQTSAALQLRIELVIDGLLLDQCPESSQLVTSGDILAYVRARRHAYDRLQPLSFRSVKQDRTESYSYEVRTFLYYPPMYDTTPTALRWYLGSSQ